MSRQDRLWTVLTITERRPGYRASVTVDHHSETCTEEVRLADGPLTGKLIYSKSFSILLLGDAAHDANRIADYAKAMLGTVIREHQKRPAS